MLDSEIVQYIIVRNDLDSMTPGRVAAQCAHAANRCIYHANKEWIKRWDPADLGFGTTVVLEASYEEIIKIIDNIFNTTLDFEILIDPEYHLQDGSVTHKFPLETCAWVFGPKDLCSQYLEHLPLYWSK